MEKPPFDPVQACFWLIAAILGVHCLVVLIGLSFCVVWGKDIIEGRYRCENIGSSMGELLTAALSAALAFAGGFSRRDK